MNSSSASVAYGAASPAPHKTSWLAVFGAGILFLVVIVAISSSQLRQLHGDRDGDESTNHELVVREGGESDGDGSRSLYSGISDEEQEENPDTALAQAIAVERSRESGRDGVRETFVDHTMVNIPNWSPHAQGTVGNDNVLNAHGQQLVRDKIDKMNHAGQRCVHKGVTMPPDWLNTDKTATCALDLFGHAVRGNCSSSNATLFPESSVLDDAYIDPNTTRCFVKLSDTATHDQVEQFKKEVDIEYLLSSLPHLRKRVTSLRQQRQHLANVKSQLENTYRKNEGTINSLHHQISQLDNQISKKEHRLKDLEHQVTHLESQVAKLQSQKNVAFSGSRIALFTGGKPWLLDTSTNRIRLHTGYPMCLTVKGNDARVYNHDKGYVAFFNDGDEKQAVRHHAHALSVDPLNTHGPKYDFAYKLLYEANGIALKNDYNGSSYVGYDAQNDEVKLFSSYGQREHWHARHCVPGAPIRLGPEAPRALPGGWCCADAGLRFESQQAFLLGKAMIESNQAGGITVRLSYDVDKRFSHVESRKYNVKRGQQIINLDMPVPSSGKYFLWFDQQASSNKSILLYRSDSPAQVPHYFKDYSGVVKVLNGSTKDGHESDRYWYSFFNVEVYPSSQIPSNMGGASKMNSAPPPSKDESRGTLQLGHVHEPLKAVYTVTKADFLVIDQNDPNPASHASSFDRRMHYYDKPQFKDWQSTPFNYFLVLKGGRTPPLTYFVHAPSAGRYAIDAYVISPQGNTNSFYMEIDGDGKHWWEIPHGRAGYATYKKVHWSAGKHTITVHGREPTGLAGIRVSTDNPPEKVVTVYRDCGFNGPSLALPEGTYDFHYIKSKGFNDMISSVRVKQGYEAHLFANAFSQVRNTHVRQRVKSFTHDDGCLIHNGFNDVVSAIKVTKRGGSDHVKGGGGGGATGPPVAHSGGRCGAAHGDKQCPGSECCSKFGWCGGGPKWCGPGNRGAAKYQGPNAPPPHQHHQTHYSMPGGSWDQSCKNAHIHGNTLTASCRRINGSYKNTSATIGHNTTCKNIDGNLQCSTTNSSSNKSKGGGHHHKSCTIM